MTNILYNGWHKIEKVNCQIKGEEVEREKLHLKSAVGGIVTDTKHKIALVKQYRPIIKQHTCEIPAGVLDKEGLTPTEILVEELYEECGLQNEEILTIQPCTIKGFYMVTGSSDAYMYLMRVTVSHQSAIIKEVHDSEVESVHWVDFDVFEKMIITGQIIDNKTIMAYHILKGER